MRDLWREERTRDADWTHLRATPAEELSMGQGQVSMAKVAEEVLTGDGSRDGVAWRLSGLEEVFPGMSAEQAAADRLYRKGSHEECILKTQAFLGDTSAKVQSTTVSVQSPVCCFSLVHLGLAGTGLRESSGQCQHLPVARARVLTHCSSGTFQLCCKAGGFASRPSLSYPCLYSRPTSSSLELSA